MRASLRFVGAAVVEAFEAARGNLLRSLLAALATAAAVATIVVVATGLDGIAVYARETGTRTFGSDTFVITQVVAGQLSRRELADRLARNPVIKPSDHRFLERLAGHEVIYAPTAQRSADIVAGNLRFEGAALNGTSHRLADIRAIDVEEGRFMIETDTRRASSVVVIGADIAGGLFPASSALGKPVRIGGLRFEVIGVVRRQGTTGGVSLDRYAYMPLGALERAFGPVGSLQIFARGASETGGSDVAEERAHVSMRARRQLRPGDPDTFDILTPAAARTFVLALTTRIGAAALPISIMALITAIVVVANTILVSVTQRLHEIGVRRAVGATRARIAAEVLAESIATACLGGAAGILIAVVALFIVGGLAGLPLQPTWQIIASAFGAAAATGVLAGYYPARQASRADVIASLRLE